MILQNISLTLYGMHKLFFYAIQHIILRDFYSYIPSTCHCTEVKFNLSTLPKDITFTSWDANTRAANMGKSETINTTCST